ncbi:sulfite exporter TauE/SafE family protein [Prolixibacteraceae bacterium Z1-6]|uniref:Sulfite exporter TauE/SafE family protein n=1 Tax=Draconibacterium aestuarii TaxID=2998507 RepID=A0A9X3F7A4_9BACT|nr:sulfite exporter TauE/SafE family protein [Prolixibacteraceae bacterium Z1-6]
MNQNILILTAASLGFVHTVLGPDHYIPFIALSKAKNWGLSKTLGVTTLCGIGHVLGSIVIGLIGVLSGFAIESLEIIESFRGTVAAWLLIAFGLVYTIYGLRKAYTNQTHEHAHVHTDGTVHTHQHVHKKEHVHIHSEKKKKSITPWILFLIFVFGPCEVLIPIVMYPAVESNYGLLISATAVFALTTISTMLFMVALALFGFRFIPFKKMERFSHALAGILILICGVAVQFLGM